MTKLSDAPILSQDLLEYLKSQDDFDLELFVARTAKGCGFQVTHGGSYEDPITGKARQYDVRASYGGRSRSIELAIECKALQRSYPLLVSRIPRTLDESFHELIHARYPPASALPGAESSDTVRLVGPRSIYWQGGYVGKSTAQVGRNEKGEIKSADREVYDKWSQALSSASDLISRAAWAHQERGVHSFLTVILPFLVVSDDTLWVADYSEEGVLQADPYQVEETTIFVDHRDGPHMGPAFCMTHLHVCTRSHVKPMLTDLAKRSGSWTRIYPPQASAT